MGEVKDPNLLAALNGGPPQPMGVQPMPFPAAPQMRSSTIPQDVSLGNLQLNKNQDVRADVAQGMDAQRLDIAKRNQAITDATAAANAGVNTQASEDQAVGHEIMLANSLRVLKDVESKAPDKLKPTFREFGAQWLTNDNPTLVGYLQPEQRQRAANAYRGAVESAIWLSTGAAAPAEQVQRIYSTLAPTASDEPGVMADKRQNLLMYIEQAKVRAGPANAKAQALLDDLKANVDIIYGGKKPEHLTSVDAPVLQDTAGKKESLDTGIIGEKGGTHTVPDPKRKGLNDAVRNLLQQGAPEPTVIELLKGTGFTDQEILPLIPQIKAVREWYQLPAEQRGDAKPVIKLEDMQAPNKMLENFVNSDVGTVATRGANANMMGLPVMIGGEDAREKLAAQSQAHPVTSMAGDVVGSIAPVLALEKGAAKLATKVGAEEASRTARLGADAAANAAYAGTKEYSDTGNFDDAAWAALAAGPMTVGGRAVSKGFKELKPAEFREDLTRLGPEDILNDAGEKVGKIKAVDLTTPQRMGMEKAEEFVEGFPGVAGQRQKAINDWNRHNSARVLARVGLDLPPNIHPGQQTNAYIHQALGKEYDKIAPSIKGKVDAQWQTALAAIRNDALKAPPGKTVPADVAEMWQHLENAAEKLNVKGKFDYDSYKKFSQQVRQWQRHWAGAKVGTDEIPSPVVNEMARRAEDLITQGRALVSRANPAAGARLKKIDTAWRHQMINDIASLGAAKQNRGVASPSEWLNAMERMDFSKGRSATSQGKAFDQQYGQAAMSILGKKPSRGGSVLASAALGIGTGGAIVPVAGAAYAPLVKRLTQALTDGRIAAKADGMLSDSFVAKNPWAKELPSDVVKQVMVSYLRERTQALKGQE